MDGPKDWPDNIRPISCCLDKFCWGDTAVYHQVGCYDTLVEKIHMSTSILVYVGIGIAFVEVSLSAGTLCHESTITMFVWLTSAF